jgi:hypothetical protein
MRVPEWIRAYKDGLPKQPRRETSSVNSEMEILGGKERRLLAEGAVWCEPISVVTGKTSGNSL